MSFLSPFGLLALLSVPVLVWLWRLSSTRRQVRVPSLIPFIRFSKRPPKSKSRVYVNNLFWLQLLILILLALALAQPVVSRRSGQTVLVILDTSASMLAGNRMEEAKKIIRARLNRKRSSDQWLIVSSAPIKAFPQSPTRDVRTLKQVLQDITVSHLSGNLSSAQSIGQAVLQGSVDQIIIVTDEPVPMSEVSPSVELIRVGKVLPNVAIVGADAQASLCSGQDTRISTTIKNFSDKDAKVSLRALQQKRLITEESVTLAPQQQTTVSLMLDENINGWIELTIDVSGDALSVDDRAWVQVKEQADIELVVVSEDEEFQHVMGEWLDACEGLSWSQKIPTDAASIVLITDGDSGIAQHITRTIQWLRSRRPTMPSALTWIIEEDHPIGRYLNPVATVSVSDTETLTLPESAEVVIWGLDQFNRKALLYTLQGNHQRRVVFAIDPVLTPRSQPLLITFFNSLRWVMGNAERVKAGETFTVPLSVDDILSVSKPDGSSETYTSDEGALSIDATLAGPYRFKSSIQDILQYANFFNPKESNLSELSSTWQFSDAQVSTTTEKPVSQHPLLSWLLIGLVLLLLAEWFLYIRK